MTNLNFIKIVSIIKSCQKCVRVKPLFFLNNKYFDCLFDGIPIKVIISLYAVLMY